MSRIHRINRKYLCVNEFSQCRRDKNINTPKGNVCTAACLCTVQYTDNKIYPGCISVIFSRWKFVMGQTSTKGQCLGIEYTVILSYGTDDGTVIMCPHSSPRCLSGQQKIPNKSGWVIHWQGVEMISEMNHGRRGFGKWSKVTYMSWISWYEKIVYETWINPYFLRMIRALHPNRTHISFSPDSNCSTRLVGGRFRPKRCSSSLSSHPL